MKKLKNYFYITLACLTFTISTAALSESKGKKLAPAIKSKEILTCMIARGELDTIFKSTPAEPKFKLPAYWSENNRVEYDFDGDKKIDVAVVLTRTFEPVYYDKEAMIEALSKPDEAFGPDIRAPAFLVAWLSNKGSPKILLPKEGSFSEATFSFLVDISMNIAKSGNGILQTHESTMMSMGGWGATEITKKWRLENGDFRLIGRTIMTFQRNSGESEVTDENLITGTTIMTKESQINANDNSDNPKMKKTSKTSKNPPSMIYLKNDGSCSNEPVTVKAD